MLVGGASMDKHQAPALQTLEVQVSSTCMGDYNLTPRYISPMTFTTTSDSVIICTCIGQRLPTR